MSDLVERLIAPMSREEFFKNADGLCREAAAEITRLQKELETAREALEDIARQRLPVEIDDDLDPDFPTGYEGCILRARRATKGGRE